MADHRPAIGSLLRRPAQAVREQIHGALVSAGFDDLHPAHLDVFQFPGPDGVQPSVLADRAQISRQAMNHLLGQLERHGYLTRQTGNRDGRTRVVRLTSRGDDALLTIHKTLDQIERDWTTNLGATTYTAMRDGLVALNDHLGTDEPRA